MSEDELMDQCVVIDADRRDELGHPMGYRELNERIREAVSKGCKNVVLNNVLGQRYIGSTIGVARIEIHGTPGNDLGAFLNGATIEVFGNAQDVTGNTMNAGRIIVHGNAWDITGLAARGGTILIRDDAGYRVGINMKEYEDTKPSLIIGGSVRDYLGEYMAGGSILVLGTGVTEGQSPIGLYIGAGIHGGRLFIRGKVESYQLGAGATITDIAEDDIEELESMISEYELAFGKKIERDWSKFVKIAPQDSRPFKGYYDKTLI